MPPGRKLPGFVITLKSDTARQFQAPRHPGQGDQVMPDPGPRSAAPRSPWLLPPAASVPWSCWEIHLGEHASTALPKSPLSVTPPPPSFPPAPAALAHRPLLLVLTPGSPPLLQWLPGFLHLYEAQQYVQTQSSPALLPPCRINATDGSPGTSCAWHSALLRPSHNHPLTQTCRSLPSPGRPTSRAWGGTQDAVKDQSCLSLLPTSRG